MNSRESVITSYSIHYTKLYDLYNEYNFVAAFSMAALLAFLALITLLLKTLLERHIYRRSMNLINERVPNKTPIHQRFQS